MRSALINIRYTPVVSGVRSVRTLLPPQAQMIRVIEYL